MDDLILRPPTADDGPGMHDVVVRSGVLDVNSVYAYVLLADRFADASVVAEAQGDIVGFTTGFVRPDQPDTWFCWQVGVDAAGRGRGLATQMLRACLDRTGATWLETTITPSNTASRTLFRRLAERHGATVETTGRYAGDLLGPGHEDEEHFRIGPFRRTA